MKHRVESKLVQVPPPFVPLAFHIFIPTHLPCFPRFPFNSPFFLLHPPSPCKGLRPLVQLGGVWQCCQLPQRVHAEPSCQTVGDAF